MFPEIKKELVEDLSSTSNCREEFEAWARDNGFHLSKDIHKDYEQCKIQWMWLAWRESLRRSIKKR